MPDDPEIPTESDDEPKSEGSRSMIRVPFEPTAGNLDEWLRTYGRLADKADAPFLNAAEQEWDRAISDTLSDPARQK